mmetsp:Transcript_62764/g.179979  ORF Transcript_62764/g.179979 Transcript_62764/m.179979 type:complete len:188 (-) Transcript_62764:58-621(-)
MGAACCGQKALHETSEAAGDDSGGPGDELKRFVTPEEQLDGLEARAERGGKEVRVNLDYVENIMVQAEYSIASSSRAPEVWESSSSRVSRIAFDDAGITTDRQNATRSGRAKDRKGTGFVTKENLLEILADVVSEDEEEPLPAPKAPVPVVVKPDVTVRCKERKGTGFVTKTQLQKVLNVAGEESED